MAAMIPAIVLAAGRSSRMGRAKALLPIGADTFLSRILRTFHDAGVHDIVVVLGHEAEAIAEAAAQWDTAARFVVNADYDRGQLSSLRTGLSVIDPSAPAVLMTLVDVPMVAADTVRAVLERYASTGAPIVRPVSGARHGHPLLIDRRLFAAIDAASDAEGAKPVIRAHASAGGDVTVEDAGAFLDVDTVEEYERLISRGAEARADDRAGGATPR
jgi:CTP:molybdopterin cytidylyltransferase MocA